MHGGAADYRRSTIGPVHARTGRDAISSSLRVAAAVLANAGSAVDAVLAAVRVLEDAESLNAARGAALNARGEAELDAIVCDGRGREVGAVAGVRTIRHPVDAALAVLLHSDHVLLAGSDAERFAIAHGVQAVDPEWFITERQRRALAGEDHGTVGAVALDAHGHLAAATSTGGMRGQLPGRVGDSPIVGAGTWADDETVAVSATGTGEAFLRAAFAHHVHMSVRHGRTLVEACADGLSEVGRLGGNGGCVAVTATGEMAMPFTSSAMFRGCVSDREGPFEGLERGDQVGFGTAR